MINFNVSKVLGGLMLCSAVFSLSSCEKDAFFQDSIEPASIQAAKALEQTEPFGIYALSKEKPLTECKPKTLSAIQNVGGILQFSSFKAFQDAVKCLETQMEDHHAEFETLYIGSSAEELDEIADKVKFDDWGPLVAFEKDKGFQSRRAMIENLIVRWLDVDADRLNWDDDPDQLDYLSEEERTLLNANGEVMIGKKRINYFDYFDNKVQARDACWDNRRETIYNTFNGGRNRIKLKVSAKNNQIIKTKTKLVHYRKKRRRWKRRRANIMVRTQGLWRNAYCEKDRNFNESKSRNNRKQLKVKYLLEHYSGWEVGWQDGDVTGSYSVSANGGSDQGAHVLD